MVILTELNTHELSHMFMSTIPNSHRNNISDLIGAPDYYYSECELYEDYINEFNIIKFNETSDALIFGYKRHGLIGIVINEKYDVVGTFGIYNSNTSNIINIIDWCMLNKIDDMEDINLTNDM